MLNGRRIADHALLALRQVTSSQLIVANDVGAAAWFPGAHVVRDDQPGLGPLAGIETGLAAAGGGAVLVLAWDMPFVPAALLQELVHRGERAAHAVVPVHGAGAWLEPLCAYYPPDALLVCRGLLARGERQAAALAAILPSTELLRDHELAAFGDPDVMFTSVDSPEQLADMGGAPP